jgi:uncharacterized membrane protein
MLDALHWLGTKPLLISVVVQVIVLILAVSHGDRSNMRQSSLAIVGLALVVISIALRPSQPRQTLPDVLGSISVLFFVVPAIEAFKKKR